MQLNKYIPRLIGAALVIALLCTALTSALRRTEQTFIVPESSKLESATNRHTHPETGNTVTSSLTTDGYELKMHNDTLEVWYRKEVYGIRVRDKRSGYVWGSTAADEVEGLNKKWNQTASSLCTVECIDAKYNVTKVCMPDSNVKVKEKWDGNSALFKLTLRKQEISFQFSLTLNDDGITIAVDDESISEKEKYLLKDIYFLPFFGCVREDAVDGYIFIPDGSGALMRFSKSSSYISAYSQKVYGNDMGIDSLADVNDLVSTRPNDYLADSARITVPVYGVVHGAGQNAVMTVIENGEEYADIEATPAGVTTAYNRVAACFNYRQMYTHIVGNKGDGVYRPQKERNVINPKITLSFLTGDAADYAGMAVKYRGMLKKSGDISAERKDSQIPLALNIIGAEISKGSFLKYTKSFTTAKEARSIFKKLSDDGINNLTVMYEGWQKGGINGSSYGETRIHSALGKRADFISLKEELEKDGGRLYLNTNVVTANEDQINLRFSAAMQASKQYAVFSRANSSVMYGNYYLIKPSKLMNTVKKLNDKLSGFDFMLGQLGYRMYSDYTTGSSLTRSEFRSALTETLSAIPRKTALSNPNGYLYKYTSEYFDMPMCNSQYLYETDTVPFLQIVLKGSIDYYAPYANKSGYSVSDVLKMIEFGAYPSFVVAVGDNDKLRNTPLEDLFSINFDDWHDTVKKIYADANAALSAVEGAYISDHTVIADRVVRVDYDNGVSIFVNYNACDFTCGDITIPALSFKVENGGKK